MLRERERLRWRGAFPGDQLDLGDAVGEAERGLQRIGEPPLETLAEHQPIDDDFDLVLFVSRQPLVALQELVDLHRLAVDAGAHVALAGEILEQRVVLALAAANDGGEHLEASALRQLQDAVDDLLRGLALQLGAVVRAVLHTDPGVEQAEVVVDLGDRAHRRAGVLARRLLVDRDRRRQAFDHVDVGLVHLSEELAGVGRQRLDVAPLTLGVDRVEGEARLARTRDAGEDDQLVARQFDVDVPQVVFAGTSDDDRGLIGEARSLSGGHCPHTIPPNACSVWVTPVSRTTNAHSARAGNH